MNVCGCSLGVAVGSALVALGNPRKASGESFYNKAPPDGTGGKAKSRKGALSSPSDSYV